MPTPSCVTDHDVLLFNDFFAERLVELAPAVLDTFDAETGRFGTEPWVVNDQHAMLPLAVAWALDAPGNPYHGDAALLDVVGRAGDALVEEADETGQFVFRKKDGSEWGMIRMPWTYSRWVHTYTCVKEALEPARRARWEDAFTRAYDAVAEGLGNDELPLHNISMHHAMTLAILGRELDRAGWRDTAYAYVTRILDAQHDNGYWPEGGGPVVVYNNVYVDALGIYLAATGDERVRPALARAAHFHHVFSYPDRTAVETVDQRNAYSPSVSGGNVGFSFSEAGRRYLKEQWDAINWNFNGDYAALFLLFGEEGPMAPPPPEEHLHIEVDDGAPRAATLREAPWFVCASAYATPLSSDRWHEDRQCAVSVFHDDLGLLAGGGNTKLQPLWSTFTVGDPDALQLQPGAEAPDFTPTGELYHLPDAGVLEERNGAPHLELRYGPETCTVDVAVMDARRLRLDFGCGAASGLPVAAQVVLLQRPHRGKPETVVELDSWSRLDLADDTPVVLDGAALGGRLTYAGLTLHVPAHATLHWPATPFNPYAKDGSAPPSHRRIVVRIPLTPDSPRHSVTFEVA